MARRIFPDSGDRLTYQTLDESFRPVPAGMAVRVFTDPAGTITADCLHANGDPVTVGNPLVVDGYSRLPLWQGPNTDVDTLYVIVAGGPPIPVYARVDDRIDDLAGQLAEVDSRMDTYGTVVPWAAGNMAGVVQAAITARAEAGGGTVRLGPEDYQFDSTVDVPTGVMLAGDSDLGTTITCAGNNIPILTLANGGNGAQDLRLRYQTTQPVTNTAAIAVRLHKAFRSRLQRLIISGCYGGIGLATTLGSTYLASCTISDIEVIGYTGYALDFVAISNTSTGSLISNVYIHNNASGSRTLGGGGIRLANMSDSVLSTINVEHGKIGDGALILSSCEGITVQGLHLEGLEPVGNYGGLIGLYGNSTSVVFNQVNAVSCFILAANVPNLFGLFKMDNGARLQVYGLKQRSFTLEAGPSFPLLYGGADLTTANVWMRDVVTLQTTSVLAGSATNPFREFNERAPTQRLGALTGNYGMIGVGGSDQAQYTPPGGSATDILVASGLSAATPQALGSAAAGSSTAPARGDHIHPTTGLVLTSSLASATPAALTASGAAGSATTVARGDHVHPSTGLLLTSALSAATPTALGSAAAGSSAAVARDDHVHPTTGLLVASALSSATPGAVVTAGAAGSSTNVSRADHVHPTGGTDWAAYTPTLGNVTVGNGTSAGRWRLLDPKTLLFRTIFTFGSTSAFTGAVSVGLPGGVTADTTVTQRCNARAFDSSAGAINYGIATINGTSVATIITTIGGTDVNTTTPFTWATGDTLSVWGIAELV